MLSPLATTMPNKTIFTDAIMVNANCLDALKKMNDNSVSAIIIDPPYGAQTHGQNVWDIAWKAEFWKDIVEQCFRVLMKGGHMVVFASGKTLFDIHTNIASGYKATYKEDPSFYRMIWNHSSLDSGRVHSHTPRSQFEDIIVYFRTGEGKDMYNQGTLKKTYALDQHIGRTNVLEYYKDECRSKPQSTVKKFFNDNPGCFIFDYKPEPLMRALIRDFTSPGHTVVDFCMRHGMTAVAAKLECRKFIGVELEKAAYDRAISRYNELFYGEISKQVIMAVRSPNSSPTTTPYTSDSESEEAAEDEVTVAFGVEGVLSTVKGPMPATIVAASTFVTPVTKATAKRVGGHIERPSKRIATSHEGKILAVGTPKRVVELYIYKKVITLENDRYLVTSRDKLTKLHAMTINKKNVQGYVADISPEDMALLGRAEMPSRF